MNQVLLAFNTLALLAVVALSLLPSEAPVGSLDYHSSMHARRAVLGEAVQHSSDTPSQQSLAL